jgi:hypothetical protein
MTGRLLWPVAIALLMPLIVVGGLLALAGALTLTASRRILPRPNRRRSARPSAVHRDAPVPEVTLSHAT